MHDQVSSFFHFLTLHFPHFNPSTTHSEYILIILRKKVLYKFYLNGLSKNNYCQRTTIAIVKKVVNTPKLFLYLHKNVHCQPTVPSLQTHTHFQASIKRGKINKLCMALENPYSESNSCLKIGKSYTVCITKNIFLSIQTGTSKTV